MNYTFISNMSNMNNMSNRNNNKNNRNNNNRTNMNNMNNINNTMNTINNMDETTRDLYITYNGLNVIKTKFDNYYNVMYNNNYKKHYGDLWNYKHIYQY